MENMKKIIRGISEWIRNNFSLSSNRTYERRILSTCNQFGGVVKTTVREEDGTIHEYRRRGITLLEDKII